MLVGRHVLQHDAYSLGLGFGQNGAGLSLAAPVLAQATGWFEALVLRAVEALLDVACCRVRVRVLRRHYLLPGGLLAPPLQNYSSILAAG